MSKADTRYVVVVSSIFISKSISLVCFIRCREHGTTEFVSIISFFNSTTEFHDFLNTPFSGILLVHTLLVHNLLGRRRERTAMLVYFWATHM